MGKMLSRSSSDAGTRLRRSKSTSTVYHRPLLVPEQQHLDPVIAQQHAKVAAQTAYGLNRVEGVADRPRSSGRELARTKSSASRKSLLSQQGSHFPPRGSSFTSITMQKTGWGPSISRQIRKPAVVAETSPLFQDTSVEMHNPTSKHGTAANENVRPSSAKPYVSNNFSISSQQIRKTRSQYYPNTTQAGSPLPRSHGNYVTTPPIISSALDNSRVSAPRFPPRSKFSSPNLVVNLRPGETVSDARDKVMQDFRQNKIVQKKPSKLLAPFKKKQDKNENKCLPSSREVTVGSQPSHVNVPCSSMLEDPKRPRKKRSFSNSLKNKLRKVFRRDSSSSTTLPPQHVNASCEYFGDSTRVDSFPNMPESPPIPSPKEGQLRRLSSRTPSQDNQRSSSARPYSRGSSQSPPSNNSASQASNSRVSSWGNSTASGSSTGLGSVITRHALKRLSVIHESKNSIGGQAGLSTIPSPLQSRPPPPKPSLPSLHESKSMATGSAAADQSSDEDSDVFVEGGNNFRLHTNREFWLGNENSGEKNNPLHFRSLEDIRAQTESSPVSCYDRTVKVTVRSTEADPEQAPARHFVDIRGPVRVPRPNIDESNTTNEIECEENAAHEGDAAKLIDFKMSSQNPARREEHNDEVIMPTPEQLATRKEKSESRWKSTLEENHSAFLSSSNKAPLSVLRLGPKIFPRNVSAEDIATKTSTNPSRSFGLPAEMEDKLSLEEEATCSVPASPKSPLSGQVRFPLSPSIYSRNTDGVSLPNDSIMSLNGVHSIQGEGTAAVESPVKERIFTISTPTNFRHIREYRNAKELEAYVDCEDSRRKKRPTQACIGYDFDPKRRHDNFFPFDDHSRNVGDRFLASTPPEEGDTTIIANSPKLSSPLKQESTPEDVIMNQNVSKEPAKTCGPSPVTSRASSQLPSEPTLAHRPKYDSQLSFSMNGRFPSIDTGRCSSKNSARMSRSSRSTPSSGPSSLKAAPGPNVYSDLSTPSTILTAKYEPTTKTEPSGVDTDKVNRKENAIPTPNRHRIPLVTTQTIRDPAAEVSLASSTPNSSRSKRVQYPTSTFGTEEKLNSSPATTPSRPHLLSDASSDLMSKQSSRPKSARDLRQLNTASSTSLPISSYVNYSPKKRFGLPAPDSCEHKLPIGHPLESNILDNLASEPEAPWAYKNVSRASESPIRSTRHVRRGPIHVPRSSSTLFGNKEPSHGTEETTIDTVLGVDKRSRSRPGTSSGYGSPTRRDGRETPGHRMAQQYVDQRSVGSGAGTPVDMAGFGTVKSSNNGWYAGDEYAAFI
ncbi:hypothetical protein CC78DRAFT_567841 [Lojkania enalia]|uniref:Uncharacterized protein n=1 Tax=Lojkania enalia TaxID=147567 RepID=A0A9P4N421_9PLEO|nr:hypothetical protein CC78DRAFT_567841 [Didymosphaeria enalia]